MIQQDKNNNATLLAILSYIYGHPSFEVHERETGRSGTKKMVGFRTKDCISFVVDKSGGSKQPIWFEDAPIRRDTLRRLGVEFKLYEEGQPRNSNLFKFPNFKSGPLIRVFPDSLGDAKHVLHAVLGA